MSRKPKHVAIYEGLRRAIESGDYGSGDRLPSEHELVAQSGVSRPTVARAMRELQTDGLIERRVGSGSYVLQADRGRASGRMFGLLIPELGQTEIFEPICGQLARQMQRHRNTLLWGDAGEIAAETQLQPVLQACEDYVERRVAGVFFAPMEHGREVERVNREVVETLDEAGIPVVLLDRDVLPFPQRSKYDVVGIDDLRGGLLLTEHLVNLGCKRVVFVARPGSAPTVDRRIAGYREALRRGNIERSSDLVRLGDPEDTVFVAGVIRDAKPDAIVCANDLTAAQLMHVLDELAVVVPDDVRVVGFDDVKYSNLVRLPLTTVHQPCDHIAAVAASAMLERVRNPELPPRRIVVEPSLVIRRSCGSM